MDIIVQKYGGTSVGTIELIEKVADRIISTYKNGFKVVVVVSAMGKTTDILVNMAKQITDSPSQREMDLLLTTGEQVSIALLAMAIQNRGVDAIALSGWQAGIITNPTYGDACIKQINDKKIYHELLLGKIVIIAGFQGITEAGEVTTLGRGGSDTTAVALAHTLGTKQCEIYTDVDGVYTADPRIVPNARKIDYISYHEMYELAALGAGVLHPRSVETAMKYKVPLSVRSSFNFKEGTLICDLPAQKSGLRITGITYKLQTEQNTLAKIAIVGTCLTSNRSALIKMLSRISNKGITISAPTISETIISFLVPQEKVEVTIQFIHHFFKLGFTENRYSIIS